MEKETLEKFKKDLAEAIRAIEAHYEKGHDRDGKIENNIHVLPIIPEEWCRQNEENS